ncbi:hypothetical protein [Wenyingzhuangia sp. IMCC45467]
MSIFNPAQSLAKTVVIHSEKIKFILIGLLLLVLKIYSQDKIVKDSIYGKYKYACILNSIELELFEDRTFKFYCHTKGMFFFWSETKGTFKLKGNKIILNSLTDSIQIRKYQNKIHKSYRKNNDSLFFKIVDKNKNPYYKIPIQYFINGEIVDIQFTDNFGNLRFKKRTELGVIKIWDHHPSTKKFNTIDLVLDSINNSFEIQLKETNGFEFIHFSDETLTFENNRLKAGKYRDSDCENYFRKQ